MTAITSPPYEDSKVRNVTEAVGKGFAEKGRAAHDNVAGYGGSEGQIGRKGEQDSQESYLSAMAQIYQETFRVASVLVVIVKNPTRAGKLRRLDLDTIRIMQEAGWKIHCQHRAQLFTEEETHDLFGETKKKVKGRMSFFKRLSWEKGSPVAAWEDIIICTRPEPGGLAAVVSPPYSDADGHPSLGSVNNDNWGKEGTGIAKRRGKTGNYGQTPGQVGRLKDKPSEKEEGKA